MANRRFEGKVAFISGVARGQGRSHATHLAREGASIIGFDSCHPHESVPYSQATEADLEETVRLVEAEGGRIVAGKADVRDRASIQKVLEQGLERFGRIDTVICNAGCGIPSLPFWEVPEKAFQDAIDINLVGAWQTAAVAVPPMLATGEGGAIILIGSTAALNAVPNLAAYTAAKTALTGMAKSMANDVARYKIRVNVVCPTSVPTDFILNDRLYKIFRPDLESPTVDDLREAMAKRHPLGEPWVETSDVSQAIMYLASDEGRYITGIVLPVDLGFSINW